MFLQWVVLFTSGAEVTFHPGDDGRLVAAQGALESTGKIYCSGRVPRVGHTLAVVRLSVRRGLDQRVDG